jgi:hypothetical protein
MSLITPTPPTARPATTDTRADHVEATTAIVRASAVGVDVAGVYEQRPR